MNTVTVLVVTAFVLALYFPVMLLFRSNWHLNLAGRSQLVFSVILAVVLGLATIRHLVGTPPTWLREAIYLLVVIGLLVQNVTLTRIQNRRATRIQAEHQEALDQRKETPYDAPQ